MFELGVDFIDSQDFAKDVQKMWSNELSRKTEDDEDTEEEDWDAFELKHS